MRLPQFPLAPFLCGTGYLFTLVADRIAASAHGGLGGCGHHSLPTKVPPVDSCCAVEVLAGERGTATPDRRMWEASTPMLLPRCWNLGSGGQAPPHPLHLAEHARLPSCLPTPEPGMDIAERGLEKHSSKPEAVGLLVRPRSGRGPGDGGGGGGLTVASLSGAGSHHRHAHAANGHASRHASGELLHGGSGGSGAPREPQHRGVLPPNGTAAAGGVGGLLEEGLGVSGSRLERSSSGGSTLDPRRPSIDGCTGGAPRGARQRGSSDSLSFEVGPPEVPADGPLLGGPAGGGGSRRVTFLTAMLMGVALCFHSLLEGAAMGAQPTIRCGGGPRSACALIPARPDAFWRWSLSGAAWRHACSQRWHALHCALVPWRVPSSCRPHVGPLDACSNSLHIFIAIVSHKGLAAYALGSSIVDSDARWAGCDCGGPMRRAGPPRRAVHAAPPYSCPFSGAGPTQLNLCAALPARSMRRFWSVVLPFTFASPVGIFLGFVVSDVARGVGAASISALASGGPPACLLSGGCVGLLLDWVEGLGAWGRQTAGAAWLLLLCGSVAPVVAGRRGGRFRPTWVHTPMLEPTFFAHPPPQRLWVRRPPRCGRHVPVRCLHGGHPQGAPGPGAHPA